jgi:hypothetical protein
MVGVNPSTLLTDGMENPYVKALSDMSTFLPFSLE